MDRVSQQIEIGEALDGFRADKAVAELVGVSRAEAKRRFEQGTVTRGGVSLRPSDRVMAGDTLEIDAPQPLDRVEAEPIDFEVVYEDQHLAVIDKPSGLVVHPGAGNASGTLVGGLLDRWPEIEGVGESHRWGIVHRLDRETSGALLIAKTSQAHSGLQEAIAARRVSRQYMALVHGRFVAPTGTIDAALERDPSYPTRQRVGVSGRRAVTHYTVRATWEDPLFSLADLELETGRTHQIRVHLHSIERFVVGDTRYGRPGVAGVDPGRVWLHASRLEFAHPVTGALTEVGVPVPADLAASLLFLGSPTSGAL